MKLIRKYDLDVVPGGLPLIIRVSKNDSASRIIFSLYAGGGKLDVPDTVQVYLWGKPLHNEASCKYSSKNGVPQVSVDLSKGITGKSGRMPFELVLKAVDDGGVEHCLVTSTFILDIR